MVHYTPQPTEIQKEGKPTAKVDPTTEITLEPSSTATPSPVGSATVNVDRCNLRAGPGTDFGIAGNASRDDVLPIFGRDAQGEWLSLDWSKPLWVSSSLVKVDIEIAAIPIIGTESVFNEPSQKTETPIPIPTNPPQTEIANEEINPTPLVTNGQIAVFNVSTYKDSDGDLVVYGEVSNNGDVPIKNAKVTFSLYDASGNLLNTESGSVHMPWWYNLWSTAVLYPTEQAPFAIIIESPGNWSNFKAAIEYENAKERDYSEHYMGLQIVHDIGRPIDELLYNYQVTGEIENIGSSISGPVWIIATLYDDNGSVIGLDETSTDVDRLSPGETEPFKIQFYARGKVSYYKLLFRAYQH